jgi:hypothetical protein
MKSNTGKTAFLSFLLRTKRIAFCNKLCFTHIACSYCVRDLAVHTDSKLHFQNHVEQNVAQSLKYQVSLVTFVLLFYPQTPCYFVFCPCAILTRIRVCCLNFLDTNSSKLKRVKKYLLTYAIIDFLLNLPVINKMIFWLV